MLRGLLADLLAREVEVAAAVDAVTREISETPELLDSLLEDDLLSAVDDAVTHEVCDGTT